jgi:hypothetical protein
VTLSRARKILATRAAIDTDRMLVFEFKQLVANFDLIERHKAESRSSDLKQLASALIKRAHNLSMEPRLPDEVRNALITFATFGIEMSTLPDKHDWEPGPYRERFPVGTRVQIVQYDALKLFMNTYHLHHALVAEQLRYAGLLTDVTAVGFYHGGEPVYTLDHAGDFGWLEACLTHTSES